MADNLYITSGLTRADAGTQDFTVGAESRTPIAAIFFYSNGAADGTPVADAHLSVGFTDGTRQRVCQTWSADAEGVSNVVRSSYSDRIALRRNNTTVFEYLTLNSFITGGVRLNIVDGGGGISQKLLKVVLIFSDSGSAYAGTFTMGASVGNTSVVTAPGFEADLVFASSPHAAFDTVQTIYAGLSFGVVHNGTSIVQLSHNFEEKDNETTAKISMLASSLYAVVQLDPAAGIPDIDWAAEWTAFSSTGFTVTTRLESSGSDDVMYLALKLPDSNIWLGAVNSPTATGNNDNTTPGFQPDFGMIGVTMATAYDAIADNAAAGTYFVSMFDATTSACIGFHAEDAAATTNTDSLAAAQAMDVLADDGTDAFVGTFSSFLSTGRRLNFTTADGTTRKWWELLIGSVGGSTYSEAVSLARNAGVATSAALTAQGSLVLAVDKELAEAASIVMLGALALESSQSIASAGGKVTTDALSLGVELSITTVGSPLFSDAVALAKTANLSVSTLLTREGLLSLGRELAASLDARGDFGASLTTSLLLGIQAAATATMGAGVSLGSLRGLTVASGLLGGVTTPRLIAVRMQCRVEHVNEEDRVIEVRFEKRTEAVDP